MALGKISGKQEIFLSTTRTGIVVFAVNSKILVTGKFFFDDFSFFKKNVFCVFWRFRAFLALFDDFFRRRRRLDAYGVIGAFGAEGAYGADRLRRS